MEITNPALRLIPSDPSSLSATRSSALASELFASRNLVEVVVRQVVRNESSGLQHRPNDQRGQTWRVVLQAGDRQLNVLSDQKLTPGQTLQLRRLDNGQLQIVGLDNKAPTSPPPPASPELTRRLLDGLRDRQMAQEPAARLIRSLQGSLSQTIAGATTNPTQAKLPADLIRSIRNFLQTLPDAAQVQKSAGLQSAIRESGMLLEARLRAAAEQVRATSVKTGATEGIPRDFKVALLRLRETLTNHALARLAGSPTPENSASRAELERAVNALSRLNPAVSATTSGTTAPGSSALNSYLGGQNPLSFSLFPTASSAVSSTQTSASGNSMDLALSILLRQTAATLARVELQQLHSVAQQQGLANEGAGNNTLVLELPVRHGEDIHTFQLLIEEDETGQDAQKDARQKATVWKFTLRFEFEPLGPMCAEVRLVEQTLSARFWTERPATGALVTSQLKHFRARLDELGLDVDTLECRAGLPPVQKTRFEQRLVDIET